MSINNQESSKLIFKNGVYQGSKLAALLFNIYIDDITEIDRENIYLYADDMCIVVNSTIENEVYEKANNILIKVKKWMDNNKLSINIAKSKYMIVTNKNLKNDEIKVKINNEILEKVTCYKYLGIFIDNKLNWKIHKQYIKKKIKAFIPGIFELKMYFNYKQLLTIFQQNIYPIIKYGIEIYGSKNENKEMNQIMRKIINIITLNADMDENEKINIIKKFDLNRLYTIQWLTIIHKSIYNNRILPKYYKNYFELKQNRNGVIIKLFIEKIITVTKNHVISHMIAGIIYLKKHEVKMIITNLCHF